jgi:hypothetical protein
LITIEIFRKTALSLPGATEQLHFDIPSFRLGKRIFATYRMKENRAMLQLTPASQSVYCSYNSEVFFPVNGFWGKKGATFVDLARVRKDVFKEALTLAHSELVAKIKG